jgi:hypothetical protein
MRTSFSRRRPAGGARPSRPTRQHAHCPSAAQLWWGFLPFLLALLVPLLLPTASFSAAPLINQEEVTAGAVNDASSLPYVDDGTVTVFAHDLEARPVIVKTDAATQIGATTGVLNGTVNPNNALSLVHEEPAEYYFEYGTPPCDTVAGTCGTPVSEQSEVPLHGVEALPVSVHLEGLTPNTTYHYWVIGVNEESGAEHGEEQVFTTGPEPTVPAKDETEHKTPLGPEPEEAKAYPDLMNLAPVPGPKETAVVLHPLTRSERLQKTLRTCRKDRKVSKRKACEVLARKHFAPKRKAKKTTKMK